MPNRRVPANGSSSANGNASPPHHAEQAFIDSLTWLVARCRKNDCIQNPTNNSRDNP